MFLFCGWLAVRHAYAPPQLASFEAAFTLSSTRGVLLSRKENVLILWLARCEAYMCTSSQLASFEAAFTPSSTRGVLLGRKEMFLFCGWVDVRQSIVHFTCPVGQF